MKVTLKKYFKEKCLKNTELIGLKVVTTNDETYHINDFDQMVPDESLPSSFFISKRPGSNYGRYKDTSELYVEVDTWEPEK